MPVALPFVDSAKRQIAVSLSTETLNRVDAQRLLEGIPSRSAMLGELIELGLALRENPIEVAHAIVEALEATVADDAETAADHATTPLNEAIPLSAA